MNNEEEKISFYSYYKDVFPFFFCLLTAFVFLLLTINSLNNDFSDIHFVYNENKGISLQKNSNSRQTKSEESINEIKTRYLLIILVIVAFLIIAFSIKIIWKLFFAKSKNSKLLKILEYEKKHKNKKDIFGFLTAKTFVKKLKDRKSIQYDLETEYFKNTENEKLNSNNKNFNKRNSVNLFSNNSNIFEFNDKNEEKENNESNSNNKNKINKMLEVTEIIKEEVDKENDKSGEINTNININEENNVKNNVKNNVIITTTNNILERKYRFSIFNYNGKKYKLVDFKDNENLKKLNGDIYNFILDFYGVDREEQEKFLNIYNNIGRNFFRTREEIIKKISNNVDEGEYLKNVNGDAFFEKWYKKFSMMDENEQNEELFERETVEAEGHVNYIPSKKTNIAVKKNKTLISKISNEGKDEGKGKDFRTSLIYFILREICVFDNIDKKEQASMVENFDHFLKYHTSLQEKIKVFFLKPKNNDNKNDNKIKLDEKKIKEDDPLFIEICSKKGVQFLLYIVASFHNISLKVLSRTVKQGDLGEKNIFTSKEKNIRSRFKKVGEQINELFKQIDKIREKVEEKEKEKEKEYA